MFKQESKRIGAHDYKVTQLDAVKGRRAFVRLAKFVGPAMVKLEGSGTPDERVGQAIVAFLADLSEADLDYFCDTFAAVTEVSAGKYGAAAPQLDSVFSVHFAGDYLSMTQWLVFCFKLNFSSFFAGAGALVAQVGASDSSSPPA